MVCRTIISIFYTDNGISRVPLYNDVYEVYTPSHSDENIRTCYIKMRIYEMYIFVLSRRGVTEGLVSRAQDFLMIDMVFSSKYNFHGKIVEKKKYVAARTWEVMGPS